MRDAHGPCMGAAVGYAQLSLHVRVALNPLLTHSLYTCGGQCTRIALTHSSYALPQLLL